MSVKTQSLRFGMSISSIVVGRHPQTGEALLCYKACDREDGSLMLGGIETESKWRETVERQLRLLGWVAAPDAVGVELSPPPKDSV